MLRLTTRDRIWSTAEVAHLVDVIGRHLDSVPPRAPIGLVMAAGGTSAAALLAVQERGHPALLLSPQLEVSTLHELLDLVRPTALIAPGTVEWAGRLEGTAVDLGHGGMMLSVRSFRSNGQHDLPNDVSVCQLTSGSLEPARLALRSQSGLQEEVRALDQRIGFAGERILCASSLAHSYGLVAGLLAPAALSAAEVALAGSAADACRLAAALRPTIIIGLAATYRAFLAMDLAADALREARVLLSAGAPLPPGLYDAFWRRYHLPIRQDYGTTEAG